MTRWFAVALAVIAAALVPGGAIASGDDGHSSPIDIVRVEMDGSLSTNADVNVFGKFRCDFSGDILIDVMLLQESTLGTGNGSNNGHTCRAGKTIKWVVTAQGEDMMVDDEIKVTVLVAPDLGPVVATKTEKKVLHWGLHVGI